MPTPAWDNLDSFLQPNDFAVIATITRKDGTILSLAGIYDEPYLDADLGEYVTDSSQPRFACKQSSVPSVKREDIISIPGEGSFKILAHPEVDGTGMVVLRLARNVGP